MHRQVTTMVLAGLAGLAGLALASPAAAASVTLRINATVVAYTNDLGLLPFSGTAGDSFYVDYTFEAATADGNASPEIGTYELALTSYTAVLNGLSLTPGVSTTGNAIQVLNDYGGPGNYMDAYYVTSGQIVNGQATYALQVTMENAYNNDPVASFTSDALPVAPWDVSGFSNRTLDIAVFTTVGGQFRSNALQGAITSITTVPTTAPPTHPSPLPVPATAWLLACGLGALGLQRRRPSWRWSPADRS